MTRLYGRTRAAEEIGVLKTTLRLSGVLIEFGIHMGDVPGTPKAVVVWESIVGVVELENGQKILLDVVLAG
jgi:hypothetical protein